MSSCPSCRASNEPSAKFCSQCGQPCSPEDPAAADTVLSFDLKAFEAELVRPSRRVSRFVLIAGAVALAAGLAGGLLVLGAGAGGEASSSVHAASKPAAPVAAAVEAWRPPPGPRQDVVAIAYAFPTLEERSLGALFDANLRPLYGAPSLFVPHTPLRIVRHDLRTSLERLTDTTQLDLGFRHAMAGLGTSWNATHTYQLYRAMQLAELVTVDERQPMREPPAAAMFYLAEVRTGVSYDVFVHGDQTTQRDFAGFNGLSIEKVRSDHRYRVTTRGSGLEPRSGGAIFAMTPEDVATAYAATGTPVAIELVFRTLPGRTFQRKKLPAPRVLVDATLDLAEGEARVYTLATAGTYVVRVASAPKGVVLRWDRRVQCEDLIDGPERTELETQCTVPRRTALTLTNYTEHGRGPIEHTSVYLARLPAAP